MITALLSLRDVIFLVSVQTTAASYEKNRARKDLLKQQLNKTLKEITQAPPPPSTDVNFFPSATNNEFLVLLGLEMCVNRLKRDDNTGTGHTFLILDPNPKLQRPILEYPKFFRFL